MMGRKCHRFGCSGHLEAKTYDGPVRCENGHVLKQRKDPVKAQLPHSGVVDA